MYNASQNTSRRIGVKAEFKSQGTLRGTLTKVKTPQPELMKKGVVYKVPCLDCDGAYIGETGRNLRKRLTEYKYAVKTREHDEWHSSTCDGTQA